MKFAFAMRRWTPRELIDEIARLAEVVRKQGPVGLEKEQVERPVPRPGMRFVADGYDTAFIRDNLERDRDNFLAHSTRDRRSIAPSLEHRADQSERQLDVSGLFQGAL